MADDLAHASGDAKPHRPLLETPASGGVLADRALIAQSAENWAENEAMAHARSRAFMSQKAN